MPIKMMASLSALALLSACGSSDEGSSSESQLDADFREAFMKSCTETSTQSGLDEAVAQKVCGCSADTMINEHSMVERAQLSNEEMNAVLADCLEKTGITPG